jgi:hypothetical protein
MGKAKQKWEDTKNGRLRALGPLEANMVLGTTSLDFPEKTQSPKVAVFFISGERG